MKNYRPLHEFISPITGRRHLPFNQILIGDENGFSSESHILTDVRIELMQTHNLADQNKVDIDELKDVTYIVQTQPETDLKNVQVLSDTYNTLFGSNLLKVNSNGSLSIAIPEIDYITEIPSSRRILEHLEEDLLESGNNIVITQKDKVITDEYGEYIDTHIQTISISDNPVFSGTKGIGIPTGNTQERGEHYVGQFRFNKDL